MSKKKIFYTTPNNFNRELVEDLWESAIDITRQTFCKHTDSTSRKEREHFLGYAIGSEKGVHCKDDFYIMYYKGIYMNSPCVFFSHQNKEHIFI